MSKPAAQEIVEAIRQRGPLTVAEYMELALYGRHGYYTTASRRSGRAGDFYTSVDVGTLFGETVAVQLAEMFRLLGPVPLHFVEAGASDGRLTRDVLDALARDFPDVHAGLRVCLVERSEAARAVWGQTGGRPGADAGGRPGADRGQTKVGPHPADARTSDTLPRGITGAIVANELLDALPVHVVHATGGLLREVYVDERHGSLVETLGPLSHGRIRAYLDRYLVDSPSSLRLEVGLAAVDWIRDAAAALDRGFVLLFDYGHEARELYSDTHAEGTLLAYSRHTAGAVHWLESPGAVDLTSHVNLTAVRHAASNAGLEPLGIVDQSHFLMNLGLVDRLPGDAGISAVRQRLAARTLIAPGGLGSTIKVLAFGKGVGRPPLRGFSTGRQT